VSSRTFVSGAYRYSRDGVVLPIVETFHFAAVDALIGGGHGWTLTSMRETSQGTLHVAARGEWEHPLHRGNWTRIVVTDADLTWTTGNTTQRFRNELHNDVHVVIDRDDVTTRQRLESKAVLLVPVLATLGTSIARSVGGELVSVQPSLTETWLAGDLRLETLTKPRIELRSATLLGRDEIETPEGPVRGYAYRYIGGSHTEDNLFLLGGDGLLAAYRIGDTTAWRAASAPS
jgi:hypothetical protein